MLGTSDYLVEFQKNEYTILKRGYLRSKPDASSLSEYLHIALGRPRSISRYFMTNLSIKEQRIHVVSFNLLRGTYEFICGDTIIMGKSLISTYSCVSRSRSRIASTLRIP